MNYTWPQSRKVWFLFIALTVGLVVGSPASDLLESVDFLLRDCERYFPNTDRKMAEKLIARLQVTINSVRGLLDSLDRGEAEAGSEGENSQLFSRWELMAIIAASLTSFCHSLS